MPQYYFKYLLFILVLFVFTNNKSVAQKSRPFGCFVSPNTKFPQPEIDESLFDEMQKIVKEKKIRFEKTKKELQDKANNNPPNDCFVVPYVVHVLHGGEAVGEEANISAAQIQSQMDYANDYFSKNDVNIQLKPATYDENYRVLLEPGINRNTLPSPYTSGYFSSYAYADTILPMYIWDIRQYLNIFIFNGISFGSYAYVEGDVHALGRAFYPRNPGLEALDLPPNDYTFNEERSDIKDGIYITNKLFASPEWADPLVFRDFPDSKYYPAEIFMHELGHWLGLRHISGDGNCDFDDGCEDTPVTSINKCDSSGNCNKCDSCDNPFPMSNYMSSNTNCMSEFTPCQISRMLQTLKKDSVRSLIPLSDKACPQSNCNEKPVPQFICNDIPLTIQNVSNVFAVKIYPIPAKDVISFEITLRERTDTFVQIFDIKGRLVQSINNTPVNIGKQIINSNIENLMDGIYTYQLTTDKQLIAGKFNVMR